MIQKTIGKKTFILVDNERGEEHPQADFLGTGMALAGTKDIKEVERLRNHNKECRFRSGQCLNDYKYCSDCVKYK